MTHNIAETLLLQATTNEQHKKNWIWSLKKLTLRFKVNVNATFFVRPGFARVQYTVTIKDM